ncbi:MAG: multifunctional oxoglutarate decarboxylase/oxoglutarate dehydrogenase thiamine pyrophosphate-binding subunit/dihydrolipoyllysine-residue succinyltransferase subunit [Gemmatimonadota bacterium]
MSSNEAEQPEFALPAEAIYTALLESQSTVPFQSLGNGAAPAPTAAPASAPAEAPLAKVPEGAVLLKGPAAALARNMEASLALPTATTFREIPVRTLELRRAEINGRLKTAARSEKLSFTHLIAWALVQGAKQFPIMGSGVLKSGSDSYKLMPEHANLGLAVDVERKDGSRGLMVPVLKQAETMAFADFLSTYETLVEKARTNKLMPDDFAGATMTLTNPGGLGTVGSVPRLMPGQGTIIATGAIAYPPEFAAMDPAAIKQMGLSKVMMLTSTYDHRVIQGAESGTFLRVVDQMLQGEGAFYETIYTELGVGAPSAIAPAGGFTMDAARSVRTEAVSAPASPVQLHQVAGAMALVKAFRTHGHLAARLDPLGTPPVGDPALTPAEVGLTDEIMATIPTDVLRIAVPGNTLAEALPYLEATYCGTIAYEVEHIASHERRVWLREQIESGVHRVPLTVTQKKSLLERLTQVEGMERFLHNAYIGAKRFSIEGVDVMIPMLDLVNELAADAGIREVVLGMAHRGRLNALAHTVNLPYASIFAEFEGGKSAESGMIPQGGTGDVKYHLGATGSFVALSGKETAVVLLPNPSHLEFVGAVVIGHARAKQTDRSTRELVYNSDASLPVTIHGDAAFPGQGVVAETLNLGGLTGYLTGGTIHLIANNQVGFTTDPIEGRSTRYSSDLAKGFDIPIVHVNADDPEACLAAVRLAVAYRMKFRGDVLIDLVGYRRHGHNESDEASYTQPMMYAHIKELPTVRAQYADLLTREGAIAPGEADAMVSKVYDNYIAVQTAFKEAAAAATPSDDAPAPTQARETVTTAVDGGMLTSLNEQLLTWPEGFTPNPKLARQLERRRPGLTAPNGIDWGHAEALAFASLLVDGVPIRLTGQDVGRATFAQRHIILHDATNGAEIMTMQRLAEAQATIEVHNSPLSELACIGFEYGYATTAPETLVLWEAQYGDFANGAQVIVDQFITSSLSKWGVTSRLTLLLPHGYEGGGPEHSSARLERYLQACAEGNIRVANPTTSAQYFHLLRRQARDPERRPLVVMTPKSLLRLHAAGSSLDDLSVGQFHPVLRDAPSADATRLLLCSGKVYYDLAKEAADAGSAPPIARLEQLYPFAEQELRDLFAQHPKLQEIVWVQEEPKNMGAWSFVAPRLTVLLPEGVSLRYIGRPERAAPSEGYDSQHKIEQQRIVSAALGGA